jgi:hypothetical protein
MSGKKLVEEKVEDTKNINRRRNCEKYNTMPKTKSQKWSTKHHIENTKLGNTNPNEKGG